MIDKNNLTKLVKAYPSSDSHKQRILKFLNKYDDFWTKNNALGKVTASCWVVNKERTKAIMTYHKN